MVPRARAEQARAAWLELFPEGFEERERTGEVELVAYARPAGEQRARKRFPQLVSGTVEPGWEDRWREFHQPVVVGTLWIGPPWERPAPGLTPVVIEPGRAFGTGAHATTRLCVELLGPVPRGSLLDVGCGSGVLAIAGAKLGFVPVWAVDVDEAAVATARRNADANGVEIEVWRADARVAALPVVDVAVANVTLAAVEAFASRLGCGRLLTSGYLAGERPQLPGFRHLERRRKGDWAADLFERG